MQSVQPVNSSASSEVRTNTNEKIENTLTEEIIIGICASIGSFKEDTIDKIKEILENEYGYTVILIKISKFIEANSYNYDQTEVGETPGFTMLKNKIKSGNDLRQEFGKDFLANLAIEKINTDRIKEVEDLIGRIPEPTDLKSRRVCYIIDSLKNKEELILLRNVYREMFYMFSVFSLESERKERLGEQYSIGKDEIDWLILTDEYEDSEYGQDVRNVFIDGDFFVRTSKQNETTLIEFSKKISRYINLIFDSKIVTATQFEYAMYEAKSASTNSSCLSRQVGASIIDSDGNLISKGWNDVPKFGGNLYHSESDEDHRCFNKGFCSNDKTKNLLTEEIIHLISNNEELKSKFFFKFSENEITGFLETISKTIRDKSKIKDLIEFSRSVHAEMHAIITGSQLAGKGMINGKLFCTTYPCHNCARHIVAAGISEVYYIEPYKKSLCLDLHDDAITESENTDGKLKILIFDGVAPRRYLEFFTLRSERKEKSKGDLILKDFRNIKPKTQLTLQALTTLENQATHSLKESGYHE